MATARGPAATVRPGGTRARSAPRYAGSMILHLLLPFLTAAAGTIPAPDPLCTDPFVERLDAGARQWATTALRASDYGTGSALFDQEWLFGTWAMAAVGLGRHAARCPEDAPEDLAAMEVALDHMISARGRSFDTREWGQDMEDRLATPRGNAALLGYGGLPLALHRLLVPDSRFAPVEEAWMDALARRFEAAGGALVETYPGQRYAVDNAAGVGALALHDRATGEDHGRARALGIQAIQANRDPVSGLLHQSSRPDGTPLDAPRGSGTFLASWFLAEADPALAWDLYQRGRQALSAPFLGFFAMREYPAGWTGDGDIDSGPLILGRSVSSTGFALGAATSTGDLETAARILATVHAGGPLAIHMVPGLASPDGAGATGSHLGDSILLAMLTGGRLPQR